MKHKLHIEFNNGKSTTHTVADTTNEPNSYKIDHGCLVVQGASEFISEWYPLNSIQKFWTEKLPDSQY